MEKLRQCCSAWFLLEQILQRFYDWKVSVFVMNTEKKNPICLLNIHLLIMISPPFFQWDSTRESSKTGGGNMNVQRFYFGKTSSSEYNPAKLLLNGVGWSIPQSQGGKGGIASLNSKQVNEIQQSSSNKHPTKSDLEHHEPWFWLPDAKCDGLDFLGRSGGLKDEIPWKIKASILYSARAHPGALRSLAVCHDECTVYTGGVGPGFKGSVQKWELARMNCVSGYYGHDEVSSSFLMIYFLSLFAVMVVYFFSFVQFLFFLLLDNNKLCMVSFVQSFQILLKPSHACQFEFCSRGLFSCLILICNQPSNLRISHLDLHALFGILLFILQLGGKCSSLSKISLSELSVIKTVHRHQLFFIPPEDISVIFFDSIASHEFSRVKRFPHSWLNFIPSFEIADSSDCHTLRIYTI